MLILLLIFVEEDIFKPVLPAPDIEPEIEWFDQIEKNWINAALNVDIDYNFVAFRFKELTLESLNKRDFADHQQIKASLKSLSYNLETDYSEWNSVRFWKTKGWKWGSEDMSYFLGWFETFGNQDSVTYDLGARFYQLFKPVFVGGWVNYKETLDYGAILQISYLRGELGKERRCVGFVNDHGEIKVGRFRERFPLVFYPVQDFFPNVRVFYGTRINFFGFEFIGGRKYSYADGNDILNWKEGITYFGKIQFEKENFGFQYFYQNKGTVEQFGEIHANYVLGIIESEVSLVGYSTPKKYITGGFSLWLRGIFSPFVSVKNLSWASEETFMKPVYYLGIRYAQ
jgi:hypothetical protein